MADRQSHPQICRENICWPFKLQPKINRIHCILQRHQFSHAADLNNLNTEPFCEDTITIGTSLSVCRNQAALRVENIESQIDSDFV